MDEERVGVQRESLPFTVIENSVIEDKRLGKSELLIYIVLCYHADLRQGKCFPSLNLLMKETRCTKPTILKSLDILIDLGYIEKSQMKSSKNEYMCNTYVIKSNLYQRGGSKMTLPPSKKEYHEQESYNNNHNDVTLSSKKYGEFVYVNTNSYDKETIDVALKCLDTANTLVRKPAAYIDAAIKGKYTPPVIEDSPADTTLPGDNQIQYNWNVLRRDREKNPEKYAPPEDVMQDFYANVGKIASKMDVSNIETEDIEDTAREKVRQKTELLETIKP